MTSMLHGATRSAMAREGGFAKFGQGHLQRPFVLRAANSKHSRHGNLNYTKSDCKSLCFQ